MSKKLIPIFLFSSITLGLSACSLNGINAIFDANGGVFSNGETTLKQHIDVFSCLTVPEDPTRSGYSLEKDDQGNTIWRYKGRVWDFNDRAIVNNARIKCSWIPDIYNITYDLDGGTNDSGNPVEYTTESSFELFDPTKKGYSFDGWTLNNNFVNRIDPGLIGDITLTANWSINSYNVEVITESSKGTVFGSGEYTYNSSVTVSASPKPGYSFNCWLLDGKKVSESSSYTFTLEDADISLTANWVANVYNITYDLDGGTNAPNNPNEYTVEDDKTIYEPTKKGYRFTGWKDDNGKFVSSITSGSYGNIHLTATWDVNFYMVRVSSQGTNRGVVSGENEYMYNSTATITAKPNTGFIFDGWYLDGVKVSNDLEYSFTVEDFNVLFEARWIPIEYMVTYDLDGGTSNPNNPISFTVEDSLILYDPIKPGYSFAGWLLDGQIVSSIPKGTYGNILLTATWTANKYRVQVDSEDTTKGTVTGSGMYSYGSTVTIEATPNNGYSFGGWYQDDVKVSPSYVYSFVIDDSDISFEARWIANTYSIYYDLDGGVNDMRNPSTYTPDVEEILYEPTKNGYVFSGWFIDGNEVNSIQKGSYGDLTIVAKWEIDKATVEVTTFDPTKGSVTGGGIYDMGSTVTVTASQNSGYLFEGWYLNGTKVSSYASYSFVIKNSNVSLEARWTAEIYIITYDLDGGRVVQTNPSTYTIEDDCNLFTPEKTGYTFVCWRDQNGNEVSNLLGLHGNLNLTAIWTINSYNVIVTSENESKGTVSGGGSFNYGSQVTINAAPKDGYLFEGWYKGSSKVSSSPTYTFVLGNSDISLEARWSCVTYNIVYDLNGGSNDPYNPNVYIIENNIQLRSPTKTGYTFIGWVDQFGNAVTNLSGRSGDLILTAIWSIDLHNVSVASQDETKGTVSGNGTYAYGSQVLVSAIANNGYTFDGWYINDLKVSTNANYQFTMDDSDVSLVAKFVPTRYSISYNLDGGINNFDNPTIYTIESSTIVLGEPTKENFTFVKWVDANGNEVIEIAAGSTGNIFLTAIWSINSYNVSVASQDETKGTVSGSGTFKYGSQVTVTAAPCTGYSFDGWYINELKVSSSALYKFLVDDKDVSLVAKFIPIDYTIEYNLDGGTNDLNNPSTYNVETSTIILGVPTKENFTFVKWVDANGNQVTEISVGSTGNLTLTAIWSENIEEPVENPAP